MKSKEDLALKQQSKKKKGCIQQKGSWKTNEEAIQHYGSSSSYFSIKVHHGGKFVLEPNIKYINGKEEFCDYCDAEKFSMSEVNEIVLSLGYYGLMYYHYRIPGTELDWGLKSIGGDMDIQNFLGYCDENKIMEMYIEHNYTIIHKHCTSPWTKSNVVIEEFHGDSEGIEGSRSGHALRGANRKLLTYFNDSFDTGNELGDVLTHSGLAPTNTIPNPTIHSPITLIPSTTVNEKIVDLDVDEDVVGNEVDNEENDTISGCNLGEGSVQSQEENFQSEEENVQPQEGNLSSHEGINKTKKAVTFVCGGYEDSEYEDSDDLRSIHSSDDERSTVRGKGRIPEFNLKTDMEAPQFFIGQIFSNKKLVLEAVKRYSINIRRQLKIVKNDSRRVRVICGSNIEKKKNRESNQTDANEDQEECNEEQQAGNKDQEGRKLICPFVLLVSKLAHQTDWKVKTMQEEHNCNETHNVSYFTPAEIAKQYADIVRTTPNIAVNTMRATVKKASQLNVSIYQAYRAKVQAKKLVFGSFEEQYPMLWDYCSEVKKCNPDTTMELMLGDPPVPGSSERPFLRMYCCLGALKAGWKAGCRRVIGLDGAFLKTPYPSQLLSAVGYMVSLAFLHSSMFH